MTIDGVRKAESKRVELNEYFDQPTHVDVRALGPYAKALIREVIMSGFNIDDVNAKNSSANVKTKPEGMADREMKQRFIRLKHGFVATDMKAGGEIVEWNEALWNALDEANPAILEKVLATIDGMSRGAESGDTDPT